ncbi:MAG: hypothetical protein ACOCWL_01815, partial [Thermoguttaceae bacterium]
MTRLTFRQRLAVPAALLLVGMMTATAPAVVVPISSYWLDQPLDGHARMSDDTTYQFTAFRAGTTNYSNLHGATASDVVPRSPNPDPYFFVAGTDPGSAEAATSGLLASAGQANIQSIDFQMGQSLGSYARFGLFDLTGNDSPAIELIDAGGASIGSGYTLSIGESHWGPDIVKPASDWT